MTKPPTLLFRSQCNHFLEGLYPRWFIWSIKLVCTQCKPLLVLLRSIQPSTKFFLNNNSSHGSPQTAHTWRCLPDNMMTCQSASAPGTFSRFVIPPYTCRGLPIFHAASPIFTTNGDIRQLTIYVRPTHTAVCQIQYGPPPPMIQQGTYFLVAFSSNIRLPKGHS